MYARVHERFLVRARFLTSYNLQSRRGKEPKYSWVRRANVAKYVYTVWRSLTNAHVLSRSNYHIKVSLLIPNAVLIATLDNLLNCSIMRPALLILSPFSISLVAFRILTRFLRRDFVGCGANCAGTLCTLFMEIAAGRCNTPHSAYFKGWLLRMIAPFYISHSLVEWRTRFWRTRCARTL